MPKKKAFFYFQSLNLLTANRFSLLCIILNLFTKISARGRRYEMGDETLPHRTFSCMSCREMRSDTTQLDNFRVRQSLSEPFCLMEPVECAPYQDACVTITMQVLIFYSF